MEDLEYKLNGRQSTFRKVGMRLLTAAALYIAPYTLGGCQGNSEDESCKCDPEETCIVECRTRTKCGEEIGQECHYVCKDTATVSSGLSYTITEEYDLCD